MKTKVLVFTLSVIVTMSSSNGINAQQAKPPDRLQKFEVGVDFTTLTRNPGDTDAGLGGRFTYNLNRHIALDAAGYFLPGKCATCTGEITGHMTEGLFGIKAGQRFKKFGIFGKARPGLINFSKGFFDIVPTGGSGPFPFTFVVHGRTDLAADIGGVLEIYPTKRLLLRFDAGTIFDRFGRHTYHSFNTDPVTGAITPITFQGQPFTRRYFQFIGGVGFRF